MNANPRFEINRFGPDVQIELFKKAYELRKDFWLDILDCNISIARQKVKNATFEDALSHFNSNAISSMVVRDDFRPNRNKYFEIGFRSMGRHVDHFLYIIVDYNEHHEELIEYYRNIGGIVS